MAEPRRDTATRVIEASAGAIWQAFLSPEAWEKWLPPEGMSGRVEHFDATPGGTYRLVLTYDDPDHAIVAKSSANEDVAEGRFVSFDKERALVQEIEFVSDDPAFAGTMRMVWSLAPEAGGTRVTITATHVPAGISQEDHAAGLASTLENLARYVEER